MSSFYTDFETLLERFCIMTVDGNLSDEYVYNLLKIKTTPDLFRQLYIYIEGKKKNGK